MKEIIKKPQLLFECVNDKCKVFFTSDEWRGCYDRVNACEVCPKCGTEAITKKIYVSKN